jgi:Ca2+-binding RTX toxin-like protein
MSFHFWKISEVYLDTDGDWFIELSNGFAGEDRIGNKTITSSNGGMPLVFTFPEDLWTNDTALTHLLIGTAGITEKFGVTPDYISDTSNFLFATNGTINFASSTDIVTYTSLPTNGSSLDNLEATSGSVNATPDPEDFPDEPPPPDGGNGDDTTGGGGGEDTTGGGDPEPPPPPPSEDDHLQGDVGDNTFSGGAGNDEIEGLEGNDTLLGGDGTDTLVGGNGADSIDGGNDADVLQGNMGPDVLRGAAGNDDVRGGKGHDQLFGGQGDDLLAGALGNDVLRGALGDDTVGSGQGNDTLVGGQGNDVLRGGLGNDDLTGGLGGDSFVFNSAGAADADLVHGFSAVEGDEIVLEGAFFAGAQFGATVLYDTVSGALSYDGQLVATLEGAPALSAGDIVIL